MDAMGLFDGHLHPEALSDRDLETLSFFGVTHALVLAHHEPAEAKPQKLLAHFDALVGRQLSRLEKYGIHGYAALGIHPQAVPRRGLSQILSELPGYFRGGRVIALGEVGLHTGGEAEVEALVEQLRLAKDLSLPVVVHTPHREKEARTREILALLKASELPPSRVLVDHVGPKTLRPVLHYGHHAGLTVHPEELSAEQSCTWVRKVGAERVVLNSDCGVGASDLLALPRAARLLEKANLGPEVISRVTRVNVARFLGVDAAIGG